MTEFELIERLLPSLPTNRSVVNGAGDDCAVLQGVASDEYLLFKTDAIVEGVHFTPDAPAAQVGHKALGRCLSDVAAMGGIPLHAVVTLGLPKHFEFRWVEALYEGLNGLAKRFAVAVVGGETVTSPERRFLSVAVLGKVEKSKCVLRSGGQPGDALFVTGQLGGSLMGRHLSFEPRIQEARWLVDHFSIHAMIDLSDGLAGDLRHLVAASQCGAELLGPAVPISRAARLHAKTNHRKTALTAALTDGEDFELLFTVSSKAAVPVLDGWKKQFPDTLLSCVGKLTRAPGVTLRTKDGIRSLVEHGYVHFT